MMNDYIDRQAAIKAIEKLQDCYNGFSDTYDKACIIGVLEEVPSAVVRCKDCREFRRYIDTDITFCDRTECERKPDDFCSYGERIEE